MPEFVCHTLFYGGKHHIIAPSEVDTFQEDAVTKWAFTHRDITAGDELQASRDVINLGLIGQNGANEPRALFVAKGLSYACIQGLITGWNIPGPVPGTGLPINEENVRAVIPSTVLARFGMYCELGVPDEAAVNAAKKPSSTNTSTT